MSTTTTINRLDPSIEAYKIGLLEDTQGFLKNKMFGQQVQNLRQQGYSDEEIAGMLSTQQGEEGEEGYVEGTKYSVEDIAQIDPNAAFSLPDYKIADLTDTQKTAIELGKAGIGSYQPYITSAVGDINTAKDIATGALGDVGAATTLGTDLALGGYGGLGGAADYAYGVAGDAKTGATGVTDTLSGEVSGILPDLKLGLGNVSDTAYGVADTAAGRTADAYEFGKTAAATGIETLAGASDQFDPSGIGAFMSPYQQEVIDATIADLTSQFNQQQTEAQEQLAAQAVSKGAYGTSGFERAKARTLDPATDQFQKNLGLTVAQMRQAGYQDAATRAQEAFEAAKKRQLDEAGAYGTLGNIGGTLGISATDVSGKYGMSAADLDAANKKALATTGLSIADLTAKTGLSATDLIGQLGLGAAKVGAGVSADQGNLGINVGSLGQKGADISGGIGNYFADYGMKTGALGELDAALATGDINKLLTLGGMEYKLDQGILDAQRLSDEQKYKQPYTDIGFASDIYSGVPSGSSVSQYSAGSTMSPGQQLITTGIAATGAAAGAKEAGLL